MSKPNRQLSLFKHRRRPARFFDDSFPAGERLPRRFTVHFSERVTADSVKAAMRWNGRRLGDLLTDNAYADDGYRFHDVIHLAFAAVLGWSPVVRKLMDRKRKSNRKTDEVEDGGRATVVEEGIVALVFPYAKERAFLKGARTIDRSILMEIRRMTSILEVRRCSSSRWEQAILAGFQAWRELRAHGGGVIEGDLVKRTVRFRSTARKPVSSGLPRQRGEAGPEGRPRVA